MGVGKFLVGCVLCVGGVGVAAAMDADTQDLNSMQHAVDSSASNHDGGSNSSGGDALGISRENAAPAGANSSSSSENCPGSTPAAPHGRRATLGWQSLLPGSIQ